MSKLNSKKFSVLNPGRRHFGEIQDLCTRVYPFSKPWSLAQLEAHQANFRRGQFIVVDNANGRVVGMAFSLIIKWDDYSRHDSWKDFTAGGFFHNHDPRRGKTLYGAEVMVDPQYRGQGIAKLLYLAREELAKKFNLKRIRAGARLVGYSKFDKKLSADEYVRKVIGGKLNDATLSFQLKQGFKVIDTVKNYLSNDPESLGNAAVIEWINPEQQTEAEKKRHDESVRRFLTGDQFKIEHLPTDLRRVVRGTVGILGSVIESTEGRDFLKSVEEYRTLARGLRSTENLTVKKKAKLAAIKKKIDLESDANRFKLAHAFAVYLELINCCETAFRTWSLTKKDREKVSYKSTNLTYVLTAHPTETRSVDFLATGDELVSVLVKTFIRGWASNEGEIRRCLHLLWKQDLTKRLSPRVSDEAEYIYSILFKKSLVKYIFQPHAGYTMKFRTWVGGDKDGHPNVNSKTMIASLQVSRTHVLKIIRSALNRVIQDLDSLVRSGKSDYVADKLRIQNCLTNIKVLDVVADEDGKRIKNWIGLLDAAVLKGSALVANHPDLIRLKRLQQTFPALVVPLELRDSADEIRKSISDDTNPIRVMVKRVQQISTGLPIQWYASGLIISNCEDAKDIDAARQMVELATGSKASGIKIVPLFETAIALKNAKDILVKWLSSNSNLRTVEQQWDGQLEIMLGYSDSAKELGVLASRQNLRDAMFLIEAVLLPRGIGPVFFHGSGGSVSRGGGSIKEQIVWWPKSSLMNPKFTVQGEMVQRSLSTPEIFDSQNRKISDIARLRRGSGRVRKSDPSLIKFSERVSAEYSKFVTNQSLLGATMAASPFRFIHKMRIGSRPSSRPSENVGHSQLRAIPWVLTWTQVRLMLPVWWGVGTAWAALSFEDKERLKQAIQQDEMFSSFVKALGFTIAKVELAVWATYLDLLQPKQAAEIFPIVDREFGLAQTFFRDISNSSELIPERPWLVESIFLRSPVVSVLNMLQITAIEKGDEELLRETVAGVACGMLTTG